MNPLLEKALGSIVRWALTLLVPFLVNAGIWTSDEATEYVAAATLAILALGWSLWQKYKSQLKLVNALATSMPISEQALDVRIANGMTAASAMTAKTAIPG